MIWTDELGRTVSIEWADAGQDVLAVARQVVVVSAAEWSLLRRALAIDTQIGAPRCDEHPWWARSASNVIVYGPAPVEVSEVSVRRYASTG